MKKILRFTLLWCLAFLTHAYCFATVYSVINNTESIVGHSDCYKITYSLFDTNGTPSPNDDTYKGTFDCLVGSDCHAPNHIEQGDIVTEINRPSSDYVDNYHFSVNPNPVQYSLGLSYSVKDKIERTWSYALTTMQSTKVLSGEMKLENGETYLINTSTLSPGYYFLVLVSDRGEVESIKIMLVH